MKLVRKQHEKRNYLWEYFRDRLPSGLRATKLTEAYGDIYGVEIKLKTDLLGYLPLTTGIAEVRENTIVLRDPSWFSDFQQIIADYEKDYGKEVTFEYWESG